MSEDQLLEHKTTAAIIGAFYEVYSKLGYGFLEHVYSLALERELVERGHAVSREVVVTVSYKGKPLTTQRLDMVVEQGRCGEQVDFRSAGVRQTPDAQLLAGKHIGG